MGIASRAELAYRFVVRYVPWFVLLLLLQTIINRVRGALAELRGSDFQ
jgi:hypothetical protein